MCAIGRTVLRGLPPGLPHGLCIDVNVVYAANGRLSVVAVVCDTGLASVVELECDAALVNRMLPLEEGDGRRRWIR